MPDLTDWSHACTECEWTGWQPPEVNAEGHHLNPAGGTCPGPILCSPPPTQVRETTGLEVGLPFGAEDPACAGGCPARGALRASLMEGLVASAVISSCPYCSGY